MRIAFAHEFLQAELKQRLLDPVGRRRLRLTGEILAHSARIDGGSYCDATLIVGGQAR